MLHLEKTIAWDILQKEILEKMQYFLRPAACLQVRQMFSLLTREMHRFPCCTSALCQLIGTGTFETICFLMSNVF